MAAGMADTLMSMETLQQRLRQPRMRFHLGIAAALTMLAAPAIAQTPPPTVYEFVGGTNMGAVNQFTRQHSSFNNYNQARRPATDVPLPPPNELNKQLKECRNDPS